MDKKFMVTIGIIILLVGYIYFNLENNVVKLEIIGLELCEGVPGKIYQFESYGNINKYITAYQDGNLEDMWKYRGEQLNKEKVNVTEIFG